MNIFDRNRHVTLCQVLILMDFISPKDFLRVNLLRFSILFVDHLLVYIKNQSVYQKYE